MTILGACAIPARPLGDLELPKVQFFACQTNVDIALGLIAKVICTKELGTVVVIRKGNVGHHNSSLSLWHD